MQLIQCCKMNKQDIGVVVHVHLYTPQYHRAVSGISETSVSELDSVHRESLWHIARLYGIPQQYINVFKCLYLNSSCCVKTDSGLTDIVTGVRQGCVLSPFLSLLVVDFVMQKVKVKLAHLI